MNKYLLLVFILFISLSAHAVEISIGLEKAPIHTHDIASIKRGGKFFSSVCMACHTLVYLRYDALAQESGVIYDKMPINVKTWPNGIKPPDLSLEASTHSVDWIYTYLHSFYNDPSRPSGVNNLIFPNTAMPAILSPFQGQQILAQDFNLRKVIKNHTYQWYDVLELQTQGSMTPEQFDATVADVVNFLAYAAAPYIIKQNNLGYWVLGFLLILLILTYLLKKSYWEDFKNNK